MSAIAQHAQAVLDSKKGTVQYFPELLQPSYASSKRGIWVYTPAAYNPSSSKRYPVLYMHDGQNLFDGKTSFAGEWCIDESMDSLIEVGESASIIVGIDNSSERIREYKPFDSDKYGTSLADSYIDFLTTVLKPYIDSAYKTKPDAANTMIAGSSMGGLISYYAALNYQDVFGKAGFFSTSFWIEPTMVDMQPKAKFSTANKYFFYMGEQEGLENLELNDLYATNMALMGNSFIYAYILPDGAHNEHSWRVAFPVFYKWMMAYGANVILPIEQD